MARIVSIETSTKVCSVALHQDGELIGSQTYHLEKSAASLLPVVIQQLLENCQIDLLSLDAVAVSSGPGSYTGLRIGVSTAKGLAYGIGKPLIGIPTLQAMYEAVSHVSKNEYFCPMIDARRMEVYCQLYKNDELIWDARPLVVEQNSFANQVDAPIYLFGDGAAKTKEVLSQDNVHWIQDIHPSAVQIGKLAEARFNSGQFEDVAYFEPIYLKEFQAKPSKKLV